MCGEHQFLTEVAFSGLNSSYVNISSNNNSNMLFLLLLVVVVLIVVLILNYECIYLLE